MSELVKIAISFLVVAGAAFLVYEALFYMNHGYFLPPREVFSLLF